MRPCNFHRKHYFPESPLKTSMSKINLHIIIKQFCITVVPLGNDVCSLFKNSIPSKKMEGVFLTNWFPFQSQFLFIFLEPNVIFLR